MRTQDSWSHGDKLAECCIDFSHNKTHTSENQIKHLLRKLTFENLIPFLITESDEVINFSPN